MKPLRFAVIGAGFWADYQVAAWKEIEGVEPVAIYNRTRAKAEAIARKFNIPSVYDSVSDLLGNEQLDFADIITDVNTHTAFTIQVAEKGISVICQKPMAPSLKEATLQVETCRQKNVDFFVHENFRWQAPIRAMKKAMEENRIGRPFKATVSFCSAFPVFSNQPFLADLENFILTDIGSHILDICRYLFGEASHVRCLTQTVNPVIKGEDVANVLMEMKSGLHCFAEMSYASLLEKESFPQTLIKVEGESGSLHLAHDFTLKTTTKEGTTAEMIRPVMYDWVDPAYAVVHSSIVDCNRDILRGLHGEKAETTGDDNLKTVQLVWACYESAATGRTINI